MTIAVLALAAAPMLAMELDAGLEHGASRRIIEAVRGLNILTAAVGDGAIAPTEIVVDTGRANGGDSDPQRAGRRRAA